MEIKLNKQGKRKEINDMLSKIVDNEIIKAVYKWSKHEGMITRDKDNDDECYMFCDADLTLTGKEVITLGTRQYDCSYLEYTLQGVDFILISKRYDGKETIPECPQVNVYLIEEFSHVDYYSTFEEFKSDFERGVCRHKSLFKKKDSKYTLNMSILLSRFMDFYDAIAWLEKD